VGVYLKNALVIQPQQYLRGLCFACSDLAAQHASGSYVRLKQNIVTSLDELEASDSSMDAVIVASGAACGALADMPHSVTDLLELTRVRSWKQSSYPAAVTYLVAASVCPLDPQPICIYQLQMSGRCALLSGRLIAS
jgi:hypothetical protein